MFKRLIVLSTVALAALAFAMVGCSSSEDEARGSEFLGDAAPAPTAAPAAQPAQAQQQRRAPAPTGMPAPTAMPVMPAAQPTAAAQAQTRAMPAAQPTAAAQVQIRAMPVAQPTAAQAATPQSSSGYSGVSPGATTFKDNLRSPLVSTIEDNVSTFSLDTDRTSYRLALNWARWGYEVEPDSVRAEEWINAFSYGYALPSVSDSFAITSNVVRHPMDSRMHLARIAFQAPEFEDNRPLNVTLVLDASGSMANGNRVDIAREAAYTILKSLGRRDRIAVVHFTDDVIRRYTVEHEPPDHGDAARSISQLRPHDSTNVQAGLDEGVRLADRARRERPDAYNYVILMSDGVANVDATNPFAILESAGDRDSDNPLRLITVGVGIQNYNDYLLEQLAQHGNGWYRYLDDIDQAYTVFSRENWLALSVPFADQTRAQVTWDPNVVASWRIIGYENRITSDESFTEARKEFAEIPVGAATTVFYELELVDDMRQAGRAPVELGSVELRWVTPVSNESNRQHASILVRRDTDFDSPGDALTRLGAIVALSADLYSGLPYPGDSDFSNVYYDLFDLQDQLESLSRPLGSLEAYHDFSFLLAHITRDAPVGSTTRPATGYSP